MGELLYRISRGGNQSGEYTPIQLAQSIKRGSVRKSDHYWCKGMQNWLPVAEIAPSLLAMLAAEEKQARERSAELARHANNQGRLFHFARDGKEYARIMETQLREAWPDSIHSTDTCWHAGQPEWIPAWKLRNELHSDSAMPTSKSRSIGKVRVQTPLLRNQRLQSNSGALKYLIWAIVGLFVLGLLSSMGSRPTTTAAASASGTTEGRAVNGHTYIFHNEKTGQTLRMSGEQLNQSMDDIQKFGESAADR